MQKLLRQFFVVGNGKQAKIRRFIRKNEPFCPG
jgi:hypothetical protein